MSLHLTPHLTGEPINLRKEIEEARRREWVESGEAEKFERLLYEAISTAGRETPTTPTKGS